MFTWSRMEILFHVATNTCSLPHQRVESVTQVMKNTGRGEGLAVPGELDRVPTKAAEACKQVGDSEFCMAALSLWSYPRICIMNGGDRIRRKRGYRDYATRGKPCAGRGYWRQRTWFSPCLPLPLALTIQPHPDCISCTAAWHLVEF